MEETGRREGAGEKLAAGLKGGFYHEKGVKLGYIPTRRNVQRRRGEKLSGKKIKETIGAWGAELTDIGDGTAEGLLVDEGELPGIIEK